MRSEWDFATIRSSVRDSRFIYDAEELAEIEGEEGDSELSTHGSAEDGGLKQGGIGMLHGASHSTVQIKVG